jgi:MFS family permease
MRKEAEVVVAANAPAPPKRASTILIFAYVTAVLGIWIGILTPIVVSMPLRIREIDPQNYVVDLSRILALGAFLAMVANPFFGRLSDRTTSRWGMRRPWLVAGALFATGGMLTIAVAPSVMVVAIGWCVTQVSGNILVAVAHAILPDQIPKEQRGRVSGYLGMCISIGPVIGTFIAKQFLGSPLLVFLVPALIMTAGCLFLAAVLKDRIADPASIPQYGIGQFLESFWINWSKYPDFTWLWISRSMRFISLALLLSYQVYFVTDRLGHSASEAAAIMVISTMITAAMGFVGSNVAGQLSDYVHRRKIFVVIGSLLYAAGLFGLALCHSLPIFYGAIAVAGLGQGVFVALEWALVTDILPEAEKNAAKNLGVFNMASTLPQSLAPACAPFILSIGVGNNYLALFGVAGLTSLLGAALVPLIRKAR